MTFRFSLDLALRDDSPAAALTAHWSVDRDLAGFEVCVAYHSVGTQDWRCTVYPFAGNSEAVDLAPLMYVGVPAVLMFRPDLSLVTLLGIDPASDYLNPNTWTGTTGFCFRNRALPPQYRAGGGKLTAGIEYALPLQVFLSDAGTSPAAVTRLVQDWIKVNRYQVEPMSIRTPAEASGPVLAGPEEHEHVEAGAGLSAAGCLAGDLRPGLAAVGLLRVPAVRADGRRAVAKAMFRAVGLCADRPTPRTGTAVRLHPHLLFVERKAIQQRRPRQQPRLQSRYEHAHGPLSAADVAARQAAGRDRSPGLVSSGRPGGGLGAGSAESRRRIAAEARLRHAPQEHLRLLRPHPGRAARDRPHHGRREVHESRRRPGAIPPPERRGPLLVHRPAPGSVSGAISSRTASGAAANTGWTNTIAPRTPSAWHAPRPTPSSPF